MCSHQNPPPMYDWPSTEVSPRGLDTHLPRELTFLDFRQFMKLYQCWVWKLGSVATWSFIWKGKERAICTWEALRNPSYPVFPASSQLRPVMELSEVSWCRGDRPQTTPAKHTSFTVCPSHSGRAVRSGEVRVEIHQKLWKCWWQQRSAKDVQGPFRKQEPRRTGTGKA